MKLIKQKRGFTLVELLVAMGIFVTFISVLMGSYTSIVRAQRETNDYRAMYSEGRRVFDTMVEEFRAGMVDYGHSEHSCYHSSEFSGGVKSVNLVRKDGAKAKVYLDGENLFLQEENEGVVDEVIQLNSEGLKVSDFDVSVYPVVDPYDPQYVFENKYQFHPSVTIAATFTKERINKEPFEFKLQTSVSSRIYNQMYQTDPC